MEAIAEQIRALIEANAPGLKSVTDGLPDVALIAAPAGALVIVLILLFMILGALGGGKKKKAARAQLKRELEEQDEIPKPIPLRQPAPAAPAPQAAAPAKPPELDRRGQQLLEALRTARAPDSDPPSAEQRAAQEAAAARLVRDHPAALRLIMSGESKNGFNKMAEEAGALEKKNPQRAAQAWRDLAVLTEGINHQVALHAAECAHTLDKTDFWGAITLSRLRGDAEQPNLSGALDAAHVAVELAKGPREKAIAQVEVGDANARLGRFDAGRSAFKVAIDATRSLARGGDIRAQHDLSVCLNKLGDLEKVTGNADAAKALYDEDLAIARHLAKQSPSPDAERDVFITLVKLAEITNDKTQWQEARDIAEQMERAGRLPPSDAWILNALRERVASLS